uniref:Uncharacterized protein n=1 Tax=Anguilla anguilla TaxID=7936 RepID=A0A0E9XKZ2_ANGAN
MREYLLEEWCSIPQVEFQRLVQRIYAKASLPNSFCTRAHKSSDLGSGFLLFVQPTTQLLGIFTIL